jgi:hypothetical protein
MTVYGTHTVPWRRLATINKMANEPTKAGSSGGHLLFNDRVGVAGIDRLCEPPTPAYGAVVGRCIAVLRIDVEDVRLVLRLATAAEDTHNAGG